MSNEIKCPNCGHNFTLNEVMSDEMNLRLKEEREKLNSEAANWKKQKEEEYEKEMKAVALNAQKKATEELTIKMQGLLEDAKHKDQQLMSLQKKEVDFLRQQAEMEQRQKNFEFEKEKYFLEKSKEVEQLAIRREQEMHDLKMKEKDTQLESMKKTIDDLKRKSEQGSMQLQGEAQELLLEQILRENFPDDSIEEVRKGAEGADCIHFIKDKLGREYGKIIYESKRTKGWSNAWVDKLKSDKRSRNADIAILVTQTFPKDMERFGEKDGIWICSFQEVASVSCLLRHGILKVYEAQKIQENKGDKMQMLYDYLTGVEFRGQVEAIAEGFKAMKDSITKERMQMEKMWKEREKQLEKVLINTSGLYGSVKGIAGASVGDVPLLNGTDEPMLEN